MIFLVQCSNVLFFQAEGALGAFVFRELSAAAGAITITCLMVSLSVCIENLIFQLLIYSKFFHASILSTSDICVVFHCLMCQEEFFQL